MRTLGDARLVESVALGCSRRLVDRFSLTEYGQEQFGISGAGWHQPGTLARLLERLTSVEWLYPAAAAIQDLGELQDFQWVDGVSFDAAVRYEQGWACPLLGRAAAVGAESSGSGWTSSGMTC